MKLPEAFDFIVSLSLLLRLYLRLNFYEWQWLLIDENGENQHRYILKANKPIVPIITQLNCKFSLNIKTMRQSIIFYVECIVNNYSNGTLEHTQ